MIYVDVIQHICHHFQSILHPLQLDVNIHKLSLVLPCIITLISR